MLRPQQPNPLAKASILAAVIVASADFSAQAASDYPAALWNPPSGCTKAYTSGYGHKFVVIHDMEGYYLTGMSGLRDCSTTVSIHYMVNGKQDTSTDVQPGEITQIVADANYAWHVRCWNKYCWGTEHEGFASNPAWYTTQMYTASAGLQNHLGSRTTTGIIDRNHIVGHREHLNAAWSSYASANFGIDPTCNSHTDPGTYWDWTKFMNMITNDSAKLISQSIATNAIMKPGQLFTNTVVLNNNGATTWITNGFNEYTLNTNSTVSLSGPGHTIPPSFVGPGTNATFKLALTAPTTVGTYTAKYRLNNPRSMFFGDTVNITINVDTNIAAAGSIAASSSVVAGSTFSATVTMTNIGTSTWVTGGAHPYRLGSQSPQDNFTWGTNRVTLPANVSPNQTVAITVNATAPTTPGTYSFAWGMVEESVEWFGPTNSKSITVTAAPPTIQTQPASQSVAAGTNVTFTVAASGTAPFSYQWRINGTNIASANASSYSLTNVQSAVAGNYSVVVTNSVGTATSSAATLTINNAPSLAAIPNQTVFAGTTLSFNNSATDPDAGTVFTYSLGNGAPQGATINASSGTFSWPIPATAISSTNSITIQVADNGIPTLTDQKTFVVNVVSRTLSASSPDANGNFNLTWSTQPGTTYQVQYTDDLSSGSWQNLGDPVTATDTTQSASDTTANIDGHRFYRIIQVP